MIFPPVAQALDKDSGREALFSEPADWDAQRGEFDAQQQAGQWRQLKEAGGYAPSTDEDDDDGGGNGGGAGGDDVHGGESGSEEEWAVVEEDFGVVEAETGVGGDPAEGGDIHLIPRPHPLPLSVLS